MGCGASSGGKQPVAPAARAPVAGSDVDAARGVRAKHPAGTSVAAVEPLPERKGKGSSASQQDQRQELPRGAEADVAKAARGGDLAAGVGIDAAPVADHGAGASLGARVGVGEATASIGASAATLWSDPEFPASKQSLAEGSAFAGKWGDVVWRRAADIFGGEPFSMFDGIEPADIAQGELGDCYFLGALSSLAEHPERVRSLFVTTEVNPAGRYVLRFHKNGKPLEVVVDDQFPCLPDAKGGGPAFSRAKGNELWVMLLEKAWAKVHGSYARIESGNAGDALEDLTGAPNRTIKLGSAGEALGSDGLDEEATWRDLRAAEEAGFLTNASMPDVQDADLAKEVGLIEAHAYAVLDVREHGDLRLIKMRNPWGRGEWTGAWSDKSDLWTDELRRVFNHVDEDDGTFWMSAADFFHYFADVSVLSIRDGWKYSACATSVGSGADGVAVVSLKVSDGCAAVVSVHQEDQRMQRPGEERTYGGIRCDIYQRDGDKAKYLCSSEALIGKTVNREISLEPGNYTVMVYGSFGGERRPCAVGVYAPSSAGAKISVDIASDDDLSQMISSALSKAARERGEALSFGDDAPAGVQAFSWKYDGGMAILYENVSTDSILLESVEFELSNAIVAAPPAPSGGDMNKRTIKLEPGESCLVRLVMADIGQSWGFSYSRSFSFSRTFTEAALDRLRDEARTNGEQSDYSGQSASGITCKTHQFSGGICMLYENKESTMVLEETVEFTLDNMEIVGAGGDTKVEIVLKPGEERFIVVKASGPGGYSFGKATSYVVRPL